MPAPVHRKIVRWIFSDLFGNTTGTARRGSWGWPAWRLVIAVVGAALLTWLEWVEHYPPAIAIVTLLHFVFMLIAIALVVHIGRWFSRADKKPSSGSPKRSYRE